MPASPVRSHRMTTTAGRLVLVTCEDWNGKEYLSNAVVIADPT